MGKVKINNLKTYAYHGCLNEERKIGSEYIVNLSAAFDSATSSKTDNLNDTVDYVRLKSIILKEMKTPSNLLENVVDRIINTCFDNIPLISSLNVEVFKLNPPINADVSSVSVSKFVERKK